MLRHGRNNYRVVGREPSHGPPLRPQDEAKLTHIYYYALRTINLYKSDVLITAAYEGEKITREILLTRNHAFGILVATSRVDGSARYAEAKSHFFSTTKRVLSFAAIYPIVLTPRIIEQPRACGKWIAVVYS